jgi:predicted nucleic acid-binding protein
LANYTVVYDACVLYPAPLRDLLMRLALVGLFRARWSAQIHEEWMRSLLNKRPELTRVQLERTRDLMDTSVLDALVTGYEPLIEAIMLPDPDDRHVVAAAIRCGADAIVTYNLKDFPDAALQPLGIEAQHPDDFVLCQLDLGPAVVLRALREQRAALRNPPRSLDDFLNTLESQQLVQTVARLRRDHYAELL